MERQVSPRTSSSWAMKGARTVAVRSGASAGAKRGHPHVADLHARIHALMHDYAVKTVQIDLGGHGIDMTEVLTRDAGEAAAALHFNPPRWPMRAGVVRRRG